MAEQLSAGVFNARMEGLERLIASEFSAVNRQIEDTTSAVRAINGTVRRHDREIGVLEERTKAAADEAKRSGGRQGGKFGGLWGALGGIVGGIIAGFASKP